MVKLLIHIPEKKDTYAHRVRNLAESIHGLICDDDIGEVPNMDTATDMIEVAIHHQRQAYKARQIIEKELKRHNFKNEATITLV